MNELYEKLIESYKRGFAQLEDAVKRYLASPQDTLYRRIPGGKRKRQYPALWI